MFDLLITSGCSFSQVPNADVTWPVHLGDIIGPKDVKFLAMGATGNGVISRKIIHSVYTAINHNIKPENILVGIMWSGPTRYEIFNRQQIPHTPINFNNSKDTYANPLYIADSNNPDWYILNSHWNDDSTVNYYKNFYDDVYGMILTVEHILRTQWFLQQNNIKYFMTTYAPETLDQQYTSHTECDYLYKLIDKSHFLPVDNALNWMVDNIENCFSRPNDGHPSTTAHKEFTERVIIPHLKDKDYI